MIIPDSLNLNVRGMGLSATLRTKEKVRKLRDEGRMVFDFGLASMGQVNIQGNAKIIGLNDPTEGAASIGAREGIPPRKRFAGAA